MFRFIKKINPFAKDTGECSNAQYVIRKMLGFLVIYLAAALIGEGLIIAGLMAAGYDVLSGQMPGNEIMMLLQLYGYIIFIFCAVFYVKKIERRSLKSIGFSKRHAFRLYGIGAMIGMLLVGIILFLCVLVGSIAYVGISPDFNWMIIVLYLGAFLVQGMAEEVLCRGYLLSTLMHRLCAETAVVISAIAFMVPHLTALLEDISVLAGIGIINLMMISVIFSMMRLLGGKLWMPGAAHGFWNFSLSVFFGLNVSGISTPHLFGFEAVGSELVTGGAYGIEASLVTTILLGAVLAILIQRYNGQKQRSKISV